MEQNPFADLYNRLDTIEHLIRSFLEFKAPQNNIEEDIGGLALAEQITGLKRSTIYCRISSKTIPHFKKGNKIYFSKKALVSWITEDARGSPAPIETKTNLFPRQQKTKYKKS